MATASYLQVFDFPFPFAPILHKCAENFKSKYFTAHEHVRKNLNECVNKS